MRGGWAPRALFAGLGPSLSRVHSPSAPRLGPASRVEGGSAAAQRWSIAPAQVFVVHAVRRTERERESVKRTDESAPPCTGIAVTGPAWRWRADETDATARLGWVRIHTQQRVRSYTNVACRPALARVWTLAVAWVSEDVPATAGGRWRFAGDAYVAACTVTSLSVPRRGRSGPINARAESKRPLTSTAVRGGGGAALQSFRACSGPRRL